VKDSPALEWKRRQTDLEPELLGALQPRVQKMVDESRCRTVLTERDHIDSQIVACVTAQRISLICVMSLNLA